MQAYGVFAGGGVRGAALAGCYAAAIDAGVDFVGFGGTSAGSIVAMLGALGYGSAEMEGELSDLRFGELLSSSAREKILELEQGKWKTSRIWAASSLFCTFCQNLGVCDGSALGAYLEALASKKGYQAGVLFNQLEKPLKVVCSDVRTQSPAVFGESHSSAKSVLTAVRASASFPGLFRPIELDGRLLTDGGLSSNLPSFLFHKEFSLTGVPTLAFDLVPQSTPVGGQGFDAALRYVVSLIKTSLGASDVILREVAPGVQYIPVNLSDEVKVLDFNSMTTAKATNLYNAGYRYAASKLSEWEVFTLTKQPGVQLQQMLIARFGPPALYDPILAAVARDAEELFESQEIRVAVMLRTGRGTRIVTYSYLMESDSDSDLELQEGAGCTGLAWKSGAPAYANLREAALNPGAWKLSPQQQQKVRKDRSSMFSVPIPQKDGTIVAETSIGTLSIDSTTPLEQTGWLVSGQVDSNLVEMMTGWALILARVLA